MVTWIAKDGGRPSMENSALTSEQESAKKALSNSPIYALRILQVEHNGDCLVLSGRVETFYHKQLAQEAVRAVADHVDLVNEIEVSVLRRAK
jgi:hypothetical protein